MGDKYGDIAADADRLNKVRSALDDQAKNVKDAKSQLINPVSGMFGSSARGEWIADIVARGHHGVERALNENAQGLERQSDAIHDGLKSIDGADLDAAYQARKLQAVLEIMSNPLLIFTPGEMEKLRSTPPPI